MSHHPDPVGVALDQNNREQWADRPSSKRKSLAIRSWLMAGEIASYNYRIKAENRGTMIAEAKARALVPVASQGHLRISFFLSICVEYVFTSSSSAVPTLLRRTQ
ncbi:hypothetical protein CDL15_Pgr028671 [Punica granatum]|uniref:Uncharacterized protein n=1 Tax=Punica granatum TaxID=22663 RepID=A0A218VXA2_PUNGR|nr:hypothetical protein CDL15_Pgr028671 [Punica granatum]